MAENKDYVFISVSIVDAPDMETAKQRFADDSFDFAANADCLENPTQEELKEFISQYSPNQKT